ncbi:MAG TPA: hypothetical protein VL133_04105, partial [Devosia sp.]|nr:hypothetical protein [Devosia sp.]
GTDGAFRAACTQFHALDAAARAEPTAQPKTMPQRPYGTALSLNVAEQMCLLRAAQFAYQSEGGPMAPATLCRAIVAADPALATKLSGNGKFLKTLVAHNIVERVGTGSGLRVRPAKLRSA